MGRSRIVSEIDGDFSRKSQNFLTPVYFAVRVSLGIGYRRWGQINYNDGLPDRERRLTISSAVLIQSTNMSDGQTPGDSKDRAYALRCAVKINARSIALADY